MWIDTTFQQWVISIPQDVNVPIGKQTFRDEIPDAA
jgi:hypothetical protein